jgi:hypothetical protein
MKVGGLLVSCSLLTFYTPSVQLNQQQTACLLAVAIVSTSRPLFGLSITTVFSRLRPQYSRSLYSIYIYIHNPKPKMYTKALALAALAVTPTLAQYSVNIYCKFRPNTNPD